LAGIDDSRFVGDFNGDGRTDLAVGLMLSQQVCLLFNSGNGQFTRSFFASGASALAMTTSDLNRDELLVISDHAFKALNIGREYRP
jgi:hypothetical protein